jgi:hypothetical protein
MIWFGQSLYVGIEKHERIKRKNITLMKPKAKLWPFNIRDDFWYKNYCPLTSLLSLVSESTCFYY